MARNGSGIYNPPTNSWSPAVNGVSATAVDWNAILNDLGAALTQSVSADGQTPITGSLNMGGNRLTNLAAGVATGQSLRFEQLFDQGVEQDVASAATTDIGIQNSNFIRITGTTSITSFGTNYRGPRFVRFGGVLTLTHNATTLILPTGANITTAAGDRAIIAPVGNPASGWQVLAYQRADGTPLVALTTATNTIIGRVTAGTGTVESLTGAQAMTVANGTRVDVASAATVDLSAVTVSSINITGTTTISAFTIAAGRLVFVRFNASLTLTNGASLVTQAGANIVTQAGDTCVIRATAANTVEVLNYTRWYNGTAPIRSYQGNLSGAAIRELTGIPTWARKIVVEYWLATTNGATAVPGVEIGPSGYTGTGGSVTSQTLNSNQTVITTISSPTPLLSTAWAADTLVYGKVDFEYVGNSGSNELWSGTLVGIRVDVSSTIISRANISFASGVFPDRVRMTTRSVDQWDGGVWSVSVWP